MSKDLKDKLSIFKFIGGFDINQHLIDLAEYIQDCENKTERARKRLEEYNKDEEIQKLNNEIERLNKLSIGRFSEQEYKDYREFAEQHYNSCKGNTKIILTGTGIGDAIECQCTKCNEIKDITDYKSW